jgi:hypothetical protein
MARDSTRQSDQHSSTAACQVVDDTFSVAHKHFTEDGGLPEAVGGVPASTAPSVCGDAQVHIPTSGPSSIYSLYHTRRRNCILLAASFASILVPFSDTIYLPALTVSCQPDDVGQARVCMAAVASECLLWASGMIYAVAIHQQA